MPFASNALRSRQAYVRSVVMAEAWPVLAPQRLNEARRRCRPAWPHEQRGEHGLLLRTAQVDFRLAAAHAQRTQYRHPDVCHDSPIGVPCLGMTVLRSATMLLPSCASLSSAEVLRSPAGIQLCHVYDGSPQHNRIDIAEQLDVTEQPYPQCPVLEVLFGGTGGSGIERRATISTVSFANRLRGWRASIGPR